MRRLTAYLPFISTIDLSIVISWMGNVCRYLARLHEASLSSVTFLSRVVGGVPPADQSLEGVGK